MSGTVSATYTYNANRQRTSKTVNGQTTYYLYNQSGQLLAELDHSGQTKVEYVWLGTQPLAVIHSGPASAVVYYIHTDHLNTPQVVSDNQGTVVWRADYDVFGQASVASGSILTFNLRFPGQYFDSETGLHYNYCRDYDPSTGRYIQSDPIGLQGGLNTYAYVGGNPLSYVDPLGLAYSERGEHGERARTQSCDSALQEAAVGASLLAILLTAGAYPALVVPLQVGLIPSSDVYFPGLKIHAGKQGKHIPGHNNFTQGRSELTHPNPQSLVDSYAGKGVPVNKIPAGQPGYRERVNFQENIGKYVDPSSGNSSSTTNGIIHHSKDGVHIVPARP